MKRVLIVDDHDENTYYLSALLAGQGYDVETARHGAEALAKARVTPPDLIVSDLLMPVMDGYTLLRNWKADQTLNAIPFIVYTATYTSPEDERLALSLGADAFILKPTEPEDFLQRIHNVETQVGPPLRPAATAAGADEKELLKVFNETLIRKLEKKSLQLEETNRLLQADIAERIRAEESLRESEERFRATFEQAGVGIAHIAVDGHFLWVNEQLCAMTGYSHDELLGLSFVDLAAPEDREEVEESHRTLLTGKLNAHTSEKRYYKLDGSVFWGNVATTLRRTPSGEPKYLISIVADITERKILEGQLYRAQRMESIGTLAGGIAHDLNNMLAPIVMGVSLLKRTAEDPDTAHLIDMIERSAKGGTNLVKQVLSFARGAEETRVPVKIRDIVEASVDFVSNTFPKSITVNTSIPSSTWEVRADPTQLNQVLVNLEVNARDAMPSGGTLQIEADNRTLHVPQRVRNGTVPAGRYVVVTVADDGVGIAPEILSSIFEPFFSTKSKGTGLGLSTSHAIIRSHSGFIDVHSQPGVGSTFEVFLPAVPESADSESIPGGIGELPRGNGELVLVVDDESSIRNITRQTLETFGYRVLMAEDGAQAIGLFALNHSEIAVVLTDMMMPVMGGEELAAALRRLDPKVKIIAASGQDSSDNPKRFAHTGISHFLAKPYAADTMLIVLQRALSPIAALSAPEGRNPGSPP
jgi:two-component system cell cycle sensor histidine kinase/response regulator CckA